MSIILNLYSFMPSFQHWIANMGSTATALIMSLGGVGVLLLAMGDSSFVSVPEGNDILIVLLSAGGSWGHMLYFVSLTIIGSVIGCLALYTLGKKGGNPILRRRFSQERVDHAEDLYKKYGIFSILIPSIIPPPMPFKLFVLSAGVFRMNPASFITAVIIGRTLRYSAWGVLAVIYGDPIKNFVQNNLKMVGSVLLGGFALTIVTMIALYLFKKKQSSIKSD
jgi:membrane protein DedA with SNARE-associated domain